MDITHPLVVYEKKCDWIYVLVQDIKKSDLCCKAWPAPLAWKSSDVSIKHLKPSKSFHLPYPVVHLQIQKSMLCHKKDES